MALFTVLPKVHHRPQSLYAPSEVNTLQVDGLARISGLAQALYRRILRVAYPGGEASLGAPKEELGRMIFEKKSSLGDRAKVQSPTLVEVRRGAGTCDVPCILDYHCR